MPEAAPHFFGCGGLRPTAPDKTVIHDLWHVAVLGSTLFAAAGVVILGLSSLVFDEPPPGLTRARPAILALVGAAGALVILEWLGVH